MKNKILIPSILIFSSRVLDLYTTQLGMKNFQKEEQNILVEIFNLNFFQFCIIDILLAFLLILIYIYSVNNSKFFKIKSNNLFSFSKIFLYKKKELTILDFLIKMSFKRILILFGSIIPLYIFITSCIFSINNFWVYLYIENTQAAIKTYNFLNSYYFFDFIIFILPILILLQLLYQKIKKEFYLHNRV